MPRKRSAAVPGAIPSVESPEVGAPETTAAKNETAGKVDAAAVEEVIAAAAAPVSDAGAIDPTKLNRAVLTKDGWLCPQPKLSTTAQR